MADTLTTSAEMKTKKKKQIKSKRKSVEQKAIERMASFDRIKVITHDEMMKRFKEFK